MMRVRTMVVADHLAFGVAVSGQTRLLDRRDDRLDADSRRIVGDVDTTADEIEAERGDAREIEGATHQRRLVAAVHAGDVQPQHRGRES